MNGFTPQFLSEGYAVFAETTLTKTGRGRSSYVAMLLRTAALEDQFLNIDQAHIMYSDWPGGNGAYFYGGLFHLYLAERFGKDKVAELHQFNAAMPIPYFYYPASKSKFGAVCLPSGKSFDLRYERGLWPLRRNFKKRFNPKPSHHHPRTKCNGAALQRRWKLYHLLKNKPVDGRTVSRFIPMGAMTNI